MGKRIRAQRYGRGKSPNFRAPPNIRFGPARLPDWEESLKDVVKGRVVAIKHEPGRQAPLMLVRFVRKDGSIEMRWLIAAEGVYVGKTIEIGPNAEIDVGNAVPLWRLPEGFFVYNIEKIPGDGGRFMRAAGCYAVIKAHLEEGLTELELPNKRSIRVPSNCRAQIGVVAGGGVTELPLVKAGNAYHKWSRKAHIWPRTRGVAMNAVDHPFGGGRSQSPGQPKCVSKHAPPGKKVGSFGARRSGIRKK